MHAKRGLAGLLLTLTLLPGCYLGHLAHGQLRMLREARPLHEVLADPRTDAALRERLALVAPVLEYAREIGLDVGSQYTTYADWPGDRVVTAVVATRPGEVDPAGFWFPLVGRVPYKGFFSLERALREAEALAADGLDTCLVPVSAYSTLGWLPDPVTGPLARRGAAALVETLIHELVHATVYVPGDATFNEGLATFVGQEGAVRFLARQGDHEAAAALRARIGDERAVARVVADLRLDIAALYATPDLPATERAARRLRLEAGARETIAALPLATLDGPTTAASLRLNDACLALAGTYQADLDAYGGQLETLDGDLAAFVASARAAAIADQPRAALGLPAAVD